MHFVVASWAYSMTFISYFIFLCPPFLKSACCKLSAETFLSTVTVDVSMLLSCVQDYHLLSFAVLAKIGKFEMYKVCPRDFAVYICLKDMRL
jgi:hypothetical protein